MHTTQIILHPGASLDAALRGLPAMQPQLVLVFGALPFFESPALADALRCLLPQAVIGGCSTAGEIAAGRVYEGRCVLTAVRFDSTRVAMQATVIGGMGDSFAAGKRVAAKLAPQGLAAVLLLGPGVGINGSALVAGVQAVLPGVPVSGGLAADDGRFVKTATLGPHGCASDQVIAIGLYGKDLRLSYGSFAGWQPFGPARKVTRCDANVLHELDGACALDIYRAYLGDYARDLPGSGLLFPFAMLGPEREDRGVFRSIIGIGEEDGAVTLAGDIEDGGYLQLMHANTDQLIAGAQTAARAVAAGGEGEALAILVSCVGRKLVMGDRIDEEVEAVARVLGKATRLAGFYANGEIAGARLHNQTMTITWMREG